MDHLRCVTDGGKLSDVDSALLRSPKVARDLQDLEEFLQSKPKYVPRNVRNQIRKALLLLGVLKDHDAVVDSSRSDMLRELSMSITNVPYIPVETIRRLAADVRSVRLAVLQYASRPHTPCVHGSPTGAFEFNDASGGAAASVGTDVDALEDALRKIALNEDDEGAFAKLLSEGLGKVPEKYLVLLEAAGALKATCNVDLKQITAVVAETDKPAVNATIASNAVLRNLNKSGSIKLLSPGEDDVVFSGCEDAASCLHAGCKTHGCGTIGAFLVIGGKLCMLTCAHVVHRELDMFFVGLNVDRDKVRIKGAEDEVAVKDKDGTNFCESMKTRRVKNFPERIYFAPYFAAYTEELDFAIEPVPSQSVVDMAVLCPDKLPGTVIDFVNLDRDGDEYKSYLGACAMKCGQRTGITLGKFSGVNTIPVTTSKEIDGVDTEVTYHYRNVLVFEWLQPRDAVTALFASKGDSGALVYIQDPSDLKWRAAGVHRASVKKPGEVNKFLSLATPLRSCLHDVASQIQEHNVLNQEHRRIELIFADEAVREEHRVRFGGHTHFPLKDELAAEHFPLEQAHEDEDGQKNMWSATALWCTVHKCAVVVALIHSAVHRVR